MVRRLLLTALVAVLAVALPAAADEDPLADAQPAPEPAPAPACLPLDPWCAAVAPVARPECQAWFLDCGIVPWDQLSLSGDPDSGSCPIYEYNEPASGTPVAEIVVVDPDHCVWGFVKHALGWRETPAPVVTRLVHL